MKIILLILLFISFSYGETFTNPVSVYKASGAVVDIMIAENKLYVATDSSNVDIFDIKTNLLIQTITIDKIIDFMGDLVSAKVYSVDVIGKSLLILSQAEQGYRRVYLYKNNQLEVIIPSSLSLSIAKAKFLDANTILLGLLSDEIISYNIQEKKENWRVQASGSKFSNFVLNEQKDKVVVADESGNLQILNTKNGAHIQTLSGQNLDNVFQVDYKKNIICSAGQDRRVVVYNLNNDTAYYKSSEFLIYSVGLSPSAKLLGYSSDENNNVTVFDTQTKEIVGKFGGNRMTITNILFMNEKEFFVSSDDNKINLYKIK